MVLPRPVIHGLYALCFLSRQPATRRLSAREVASSLGLPPEQTAKVLRALARQGLIEGQRGQAGGYRLARLLEEITLAEVADAVLQTDVSARPAPTACLAVSKSARSTHAGFVVIHERIHKLLEAAKLADVMGLPSGQRWGPDAQAWLWDGQFLQRDRTEGVETLCSRT